MYILGLTLNLSPSSQRDSAKIFGLFSLQGSEIAPHIASHIFWDGAYIVMYILGLSINMSPSSSCGSAKIFGLFSLRGPKIAPHITSHFLGTECIFHLNITTLPRIFPSKSPIIFLGVQTI